MCFNEQNTALLSGFFVFHRLFVCASNRTNIAFKMNIIEDTHLTLAGIPFKVEVINSLISLPLQTYEKKFAEFPFLVVYNALVQAKIVSGVVYFFFNGINCWRSVFGFCELAQMILRIRGWWQRFFIIRVVHLYY